MKAIHKGLGSPNIMAPRGHGYIFPFINTLCEINRYPKSQVILGLGI